VGILGIFRGRISLRELGVGRSGGYRWVGEAGGGPGEASGW
jgi:hypothetical protein